MRNPNHYGTVTKLSGKRRRPYVVKEGISGRQKPIGYTATREEGLILLAEYNQSPWNIDESKITLQELYELWLEKRGSKLNKQSLKNLKCAYIHISDLANMRFCDIKSYQMQDCIDNCGYGYATQNNVKNLWRKLDDFASELDITSKHYSTVLTADPAPETSRTVFTNDEVNRVWDNIEIPWDDSILFLLYTGFRFSEMLQLKISDVNLEEGTMIGGIKTAAGKNRIVPIHSKIRPIVEKHYEGSCAGYLFEYNSGKLSATKYREIWSDLMEKLEMDHTPHECRHTFRSRLDSAGANKVCIDRIMGHKSADTGERVYTHKTIEELKSNIELITN